jgi:hypothetical protein
MNDINTHTHTHTHIHETTIGYFHRELVHMYGDCDSYVAAQRAKHGVNGGMSSSGGGGVGGVGNSSVKTVIAPAAGTRPAATAHIQSHAHTHAHGHGSLGAPPGMSMTPNQSLAQVGSATALVTLIRTFFRVDP